jgi:hypothetical protein
LYLNSVAKISQAANIPVDQLLPLCKNERQKAAQRMASKSTSNSSSSSEGNLGVNVPIEGIPVGFDAGSKDSFSSSKTNSSSSGNSSSYTLSDCDSIFKTYGEITIAEINSDREKAIAVINGKFTLAVTIKQEDGKNTRTQIWSDTEKYKSDNELKGTKVQANAGIAQTGIGAGAQVLIGLINRPPRPKDPAPINPPQQVATASTDPVNNLFREWGWQKVSCAPGLVFIKGLSAETVCTNPTNTIPAGEYFYNSSNSQLEPVAVSSSSPQINHSSISEEENTVGKEMNETTQEEEE